MTWDEGRCTCESEGAHLAVLDSREEMQSLSNTVGLYAWIRVYRQHPSSPWMTVLGQPLNASFTIWLQDPPACQGNCGTLYYSFGINNHGCSSSTDRSAS